MDSLREKGFLKSRKQNIKEPAVFQAKVIEGIVIILFQSVQPHMINSSLS